MTVYAVLGIVVALFGLIAWSRRTGGSLEKLKQAEARIEAIHDKKEKDDEVANLAPADLDKRFDRWLR